MKNPLVLCTCLAIHFLRDAGFRGLNEFKTTFLQDFKPKGRKMLRPAHGLVIILGFFIIFGLPATVRSEEEPNAKGVEAPVDGSNSTTSSTTVPSAEASRSTTATLSTEVPAPSNGTLPPDTPPTNSTIPELEEIFVTYTFTGNFDLGELLKLFNGTIGTVTIFSGNDGPVAMSDSFGPLKTVENGNVTSLETIKEHYRKSKNKLQKYNVALQFRTTASSPATSTVEPVTPPITTLASTTAAITSTTERSSSSPPSSASPQTSTSMKVLLMLILSMVVILILSIVYRCLTVDGCWIQFTTGCAQRGSRVRASLRERPNVRSIISPIRNRLVNRGIGEAHQDYPLIDAELYERL